MTNLNLAMGLRGAYMAMHRKTNTALLKLGITADQFVIMVILDESPGVIQQELVKLANSDPNTMRAMLLILEKKELIERKKHPNDGRAFQVYLTAKGAQLFQKLLNTLRPLRNKMLSLFNEKEFNDFYFFLKRMSDELI